VHPWKKYRTTETVTAFVAERFGKVEGRYSTVNYKKGEAVIKLDNGHVYAISADQFEKDFVESTDVE
jgi:coenzyme F420-reducing hydrogenase beta subunit